MCDHFPAPAAESRRAFLKKTGALALFGIGIGGVPGFVKKAVAGYRYAPYRSSKILVCIFQRGAMDGLMAVTPFTDAALRAARPSLFMDAIKNKEGSLLELDGRFGMHPGLKSLLPYFSDGRLAIVHGIGSPNNTRSHFDAQDYMESGTPFRKGTESGWLNRAIGALGHDGGPFRGVSITTSLPRSFYGPEPALAISNLDEFGVQLRGNPGAALGASNSFEQLYDQAANDILGHTGRESFEAVKMLKEAKSDNYNPANAAVYPANPVGNALRQIARLIKMDVGLEIAFAESGGWDTHNNQGRDTGIFARNITGLAEAISAFWMDMEAYQDRVELMTMTEFGRTVKQNGTGGTDHGRGSCMFVLGNQVKGGRVYGTVPDLSPENLADGRDLPVTTDFRDLFSDVAMSHLKLKNNSALFPDFKPWKAGAYHKI